MLLVLWFLCCFHFILQIALSSCIYLSITVPSSVISNPRCDWNIWKHNAAGHVTNHNSQKPTVRQIPWILFHKGTRSVLRFPPQLLSTIPWLLTPFMTTKEKKETAMFTVCNSALHLRSPGSPWLPNGRDDRETNIDHPSVPPLSNRCRHRRASAR